MAKELDLDDVKRDADVSVADEAVPAGDAGAADADVAADDADGNVTADSEGGSAGGRAALLARLREKYPDREFGDDDDDALYAGLDEYANERDEELSRYRDNEKALSDMFAKDGRSAHFLNAWRNGGDPTAEFIRMFGPELVARMDDPEVADEIAAANKDWLEREAKNKALEDEYRENIQTSRAELDGMQERGELTNEDVQEAMKYLIDLASDVIRGRFTADNVKLALGAVRHDADVAAAERTGEVRGRNARIDEKLRKRGSGDGLPVLDGRNNSGGAGNVQRPSLGALDRFGDEASGDIWERGGFTRKRNG